MRSELRKTAWISKDAAGSAGGMLSYWDPELFEGSLKCKGRYSLTIKLITKKSSFLWMLSNIYGPHNQHEWSLLFTEQRARDRVSRFYNSG